MHSRMQGYTNGTSTSVFCQRQRYFLTTLQVGIRLQPTGLRHCQGEEQQDRFQRNWDSILSVLIALIERVFNIVTLSPCSRWEL